MQIHRGFTLLELLATLALAAAVLAMAIPAYQGLLLQNHRATARTALWQTAQKLQQHIAHYGGLDATAHALLPATTTHYQYQLRIDNNSSYTLHAHPLGAQAQDICGELMLDHRLIRGAAGILHNRAALTQRCWP